MSDAYKTELKTERKADVEVAEVEHEKERSGDVAGPTDIDHGYSLADIRAVTRKVDRRLIPVLSLLYCISFIDRTNLSLARAANGQIMNEELDLLNGNNRYGLATLIFFIPYIIFEIPVSGLCVGKGLDHMVFLCRILHIADAAMCLASRIPLFPHTVALTPVPTWPPCFRCPLVARHGLLPVGCCDVSSQNLVPCSHIGCASASSTPGRG